MSNIVALNQMAMFIQSAVFYEQEHLLLVSGLCKDSKPRSMIYMKTALQLTENIFELLETSNTTKLVTRKKKKVAGNISGDESEQEEDAQQKSAMHERLYTLSKIEQVNISN